MVDDGLNSLRKEIDETDRELARLIRKRFAIADKIAEHKEKAGMPVLDLEREQEVIGRVKAIARQEGIDEVATESIFREIIAQSRKRQLRRQQR